MSFLHAAVLVAKISFFSLIIPNKWWVFWLNKLRSWITSFFHKIILHKAALFYNWWYNTKLVYQQVCQISTTKFRAKRDVFPHVYGKRVRLGKTSRDRRSRKVSRQKAPNCAARPLFTLAKWSGFLKPRIPQYFRWTGGNRLESGINIWPSGERVFFDIWDQF